MTPGSSPALLKALGRALATHAGDGRADRMIGTSVSTGLRRALSSFTLLLLALQGSAGAGAADGYVVVNRFPHDPGAFTQGLDFHRGQFFETTGQNPASLRRVDLETGKVRKQVRLNERRYFGEGMTVIGDRLWWITWTSERAFVYDPGTFKRRRSVTYAGEGWGLTHNGKRLIMSNGTSELAFRNPRTFEITRTIEVTDEGAPVDDLNELEWINGEILANVWLEDVIARIDPKTGEVTDWIDVSALKAKEADGNETNGIAYLKKSDRLFVTGKNWSHVYEIELTG
jgi:glutaminyl-peptide cyclotransferase